MTQHVGAPTRRFWWNIPGAGMLCLLLVIMLAACGSNSPGEPSSFPKDKLSLLRVPTSYALPGQIVRGPDGNLWFPAIAYVNFTTNQPSGSDRPVDTRRSVSPVHAP